MPATPLSRDYSAAKVSVVANSLDISDFPDGTFVNVSMNSPASNEVIGADGAVARALTNDKSFTATLTILQTSRGNDVLMSLYLSQLAFEFHVIDHSGNTKYISPRAWVKQPADSEFAKEVSSREWTIFMAETEFFIGGTRVIDVLAPNNG